MESQGARLVARHFSSLSDPELLEMIRGGAIGIIPTDTVYGLVAPALSEQSVQRMYGIKSRERQPGTTIAASIDQLLELGFPNDMLLTARKYWPNAVSVEMNASKVSTYLSTGQPVMAARIPNKSDLTALLKVTGPLMTSSANAPQQPTSTSVGMAIDYFGDEVDYYVDGGDLSGRPPSTIIGINTDQTITVYRHGAVEIT